jgi:predicted AlkP superfamily pyrophosphatase or phosphodiesterase
MSFLRILILGLLAAGPVRAEQAAGRAEHVVVVVWDGMRPDFITPQYTPTLYNLAKRGTFFKNHHSAYITSTEVNATALATGMHPEHSGIIANSEYDPDYSWLASYGTESLDVVRRGDRLSHGHYLEAPTVAELLHQAGFPTVVAGAKPVALLHDRAPSKSTPAEKASVTLFRGQTLPRAALDELAKNRDIGAMPSTPSPDADPSKHVPNPVDAWTSKALVHGLWKKTVPRFSLLWLSEPDSAQHDAGVGSDAAVTALANSDMNLSNVIKTLEAKNLIERTDLLVVSDHGFSTIQRGPDIIESLKRAGFTAGKQFQNPETGDILVNMLGGTTAFHVFDHDEAVIRRLVAFLQGTDFAAVIFCALPIDGTFSLSQVHLRPTNNSPDVVVAMQWSADKNDFGAPGLLTSPEGKKGHGTHASLSRFDLHNMLIAAGPDFKREFVNELPSGNIDLAPTILAILGVTTSQPMDGRVLYEAMTCEAPPQPKPLTKTIEASHDLGFLTWHQYLKFTQMGSSTYYDEGNGGCGLK